MIDIVDREASLPLLVKYLKKGTEPPINTRTYIMVSRYLKGWEGLYLDKPPRLTLEGGTLLLMKWLEGIKLPKGRRNESRNSRSNKHVG